MRLLLQGLLRLSNSTFIIRPYSSGKMEEAVLGQLTSAVGEMTAKAQTQFDATPNVFDFYNESFKDLNERRKWFIPWVVAFKAFKSTTTEEYNAAVKPVEGTPAFAKLVEAESKWDQVLQKTIDAKILDVIGPRPKTVPNLDDIKLISMANDKTVTLKEILADHNRTFIDVLRHYNCPVCVRHAQGCQTILAKFEMKKVGVVIICKGTKENGHVWMEKNNITLPMFIDESGSFYDTLKFPVATWNTCRAHMAKLAQAPAIIAGRGQTIDDKIHDINQLGGDLIMNKNGDVLYGYYSTSSVDRPPPDEVLRQC